MYPDLKYLISTFRPADRRRLVLSVIALFAIATMDALSIAAIFPIMQVVTGSPLDQGTLGKLYDWVGHPGQRQFVIYLALCMMSLFVLKAIAALALTWWNGRLVNRLQLDTSRTLLSNYMTEDYLTHRQRHTGEILRTLGSSVTDAHSKVLGGIMGGLSSMMSIALIMGLLLIVAPVPSLLAIAYFAVTVFFIQRVLGPYNRRAGEQAQHASWLSSHALIDTMHGFRESILHNAKDYFLARFDAANRRTADASLKANYLSTMPKYILEVLTMVGLVALIVVSFLSGSADDTMPTLSLFVAAVIKLLPLLVALTTTIGVIRTGREGLRLTVEALRQQRSQHSYTQSDSPLSFRKDSPERIEVNHVSFHYPGDSTNVLTDVTLDVPPGTSLAICGASGAGKTTLVDIILGLIPPTSGQVTYDGASTAQAGEGWYNVVAYVPQDVYITDDTLAGNVAYGVAPHDRDNRFILECLTRASLGDLIAQLPEGVDTLVGERGSRLSGGQRQRIGIARALYRRPRVLVLDEATSALDNETESEITRTLASVHGSISTIVVAHRLSTVKHVDKLAFLKGGSVQAIGTFAEVRNKSDDFARLVKLGNLDG